MLNQPPRIGPISSGLLKTSGGGGGGIPIVSCPTALPNFGPTIWDTGNIDTPGGSPIVFANGFVLPDTRAPYLAVVLWDARRTDTSAMNHGGVSSFSNYTDDCKTIPDFPVDDIAHLAILGHYGGGGIPPELIVNFTPSWTGGWTGGDSMTRVIGCLIPTASAAPRQIAPAAASSASITFPAPVANGSLAIAALIAETSGSFLPPDWTLIATANMPIGLTGGTEMVLIGKCMTGTEGATLDLTNESRPHWWMGIEVVMS